MQNGNAYEEGLREFWEPFKAYWEERIDAKRARRCASSSRRRHKFAVHDGVARRQSRSRPTPGCTTRRCSTGPGTTRSSCDLFYDYGTNLPLYPAVRSTSATAQPPTLIVWGKNDMIFPADGRAALQARPAATLEFHLLDTGHFALEDKGDEIAP